MRQGKHTPALERRPVLFSDLTPVWEVFWLLHSSRTSGMSGPDPFKVSEINAALDLLAVSPGRRFVYATWLKHMDKVYFDFVVAQQRSQKKGQKQEYEEVE